MKKAATAGTSALGKRKGRPPKSKNQTINGVQDDINFLDDESDLSFDEYMDTSDGETNSKKRGRSSSKPKTMEHSSGLRDEESDIDEIGETKVDKDGHLLEGRHYKVPTFELPERGHALFMFSKDPAALLGFRDSFVFIKKNPKLVKVYVTDSEKSYLVDTNKLRSTFRTREVSVVSARSVFKVFGHRVVKKGRRGKDDYYYTGEYDENEDIVDSDEDHQLQQRSDNDKSIISGTNVALNSATGHHHLHHQLHHSWQHSALMNRHGGLGSLQHQSALNSNLIQSNRISGTPSLGDPSSSLSLSSSSSPSSAAAAAVAAATNSANLTHSMMSGSKGINGSMLNGPGNGFGVSASSSLALSSSSSAHQHQHHLQHLMATNNMSASNNMPVNIKQINVPVSLKATLEPLNAYNWLHHAAVSVRDFSAQLHSYRQNNTTFYDIHTNVYQIPHTKQAIAAPKTYHPPSSQPSSQPFSST